MSLSSSRRLSALLVSGVLLSGASHALARLGETKEECVARYGEPVASTPALLSGAESLSFLKNQVRIRVEFLNNRAVFISFMRQDMSSNDQQQLLEANRGDLVWSSPEDYAGRKFWLAKADLDDEEKRYATAYTISKIGVLEISLQPWVEAMKAQKTALDAMAREGRGAVEEPAKDGDAAKDASGDKANDSSDAKPAAPAKKSNGLEDF